MSRLESCRDRRHFLPRLARVLVLLAVLVAGIHYGQAAQYPCFNLNAASLPGRTLWMKVDSGSAPYETTGSYALQLRADGSFVVAATNGIAARTGTWTASTATGDLVITLQGFMSDGTRDVLALFAGCLNGAACTSCGYALTREGVAGLQFGSYILTDGEAPPAGSVPVVTVLSGGGTYPAGANVFLYAQAAGNPNSIKVKWYKDDVLIPGQTQPFFFLNGVDPAASGVYRADLSNAAGTVKVSTRVSVHPATEAPTSLGRAWVRIADDRTPIPGTSSKIAPLRPRSASVRDGVVQVLDPAGLGLVRWTKGTLSTVLAEGASLPGGVTLSGIQEATEFTGGAVDAYVRHSAGFGIYEVRDSVVSRVAGVGDPMPQSQGVFGGFLWLARRDARLVFSAANSLGKVGVFSWDGTNLTTLLAPAQDLPGLLGPIQQALSLKFDGTTVVLQANDSVQIQGNNRQGIFRYTAAAGWTEIANATQPLPGNPSTAHKIFNGVDVANGTVFFTSGPSLGYQLYAADAVGGPRFVGPSASADLVTAQFSAASPLQAYLRNPPNLELVGNGLSDRVLGVGETLDGKKVSGVLDVDSQGNDLVVTLEFEDASTAVYAALGAPVSTVPLVLNSPVFVQGAMQFTLATRAGVQYGVEFKTSFGDPAWTPWRTINGDGNPQTVSISTSTTAAFFRVVELAP